MDSPFIIWYVCKFNYLLCTAESYEARPAELMHRKLFREIIVLFISKYKLELDILFNHFSSILHDYWIRDTLLFIIDKNFHISNSIIFLFSLSELLRTEYTTVKTELSA